MKEHIFAIDIGTRSVVGLLCRITDSGGIRVEHHYIQGHPRRAMLDGQIHDVGQVSAVLTQVKEALEEKAGYPLEKAAIAAAGRALTTLRTETELEFSDSREITAQELHNLEALVLAKAREEMAREKDSLYCVGYSPVSYSLNGMKITNPLGQRGSSVGVKIIATFLPQVVVDSLFSALNKAGLEVGSLTLEPIAAMAVAVPPHLRSLNLALVDIGAGTSDIAVSRQGTIISYGMVDMAGDEITEIIAQHYLLDFNAAEAVKTAIAGQEHVEFIDVLGNKYREERQNILDVIEPGVERLALALASTIKDNNGGGSPSAVFCAGGGSLTPLLQDYLARHLELPSERIGIRTRANLEGISFDGDELMGPDAVTPLGIALTAYKSQEQYIDVWVNGREISLFNVQKTSVAQALIHSGMDLSTVLEAGEGSITFTLNGQDQTLTGQMGKAGSILVNDVAATLDAEIVAGDRVQVSPGVGAVPPRVSLGDMAAEFQSIEVMVNDSMLQLPLVQRINGLPATQDTLIQPGDNVEIRSPANVGELATMMDLDLSQLEVKVDGIKANSTTAFTRDSVISIEAVDIEKETIPQSGSISVTVNGKHCLISQDKASLIDALAQANIDFNVASGIPRIILNGVDADFASPLRPGDKIEVLWGAKSG